MEIQNIVRGSRGKPIVFTTYTVEIFSGHTETNHELCVD